MGPVRSCRGAPGPGRFRLGFTSDGPRSDVHLLLTDRLACPRCGPTFGLILLAHRMEDRRVREGQLGCPNCRDTFPVADGFADLRAPPRGELPEGWAGSSPGESGPEGDRLVALLGLSGGPGTAALVGAPARHLQVVAGASGDVHVVGVDPDLEGWSDVPGASRIAALPGLPFFSGSLRAVAVDGRLGTPWLDEAARAVARGGRIVVVNASEGSSEALVSAGLAVLASDAETVVATRG